MTLNISKQLEIKTKTLLEYVKKPHFLWSTFWLFTSTLAFTYFLITSVGQFTQLVRETYILSPNLTLIVAIIIFISLIGLFSFFVQPGLQLNKQKIHSQPSWVFYSYWSLINSFIICGAFKFFYESKEYWWNGSWPAFIFVALLIVATKWLNEFVGQKIDLTFREFAAGAVGIENDELGFKSTAKNVADGLLKLDKYINVVGLYGGLGFGKSSYARMILENFDVNKTLYTYISLTETNEAKDFSSLFSERWLETLSQRYPKIDVTSYLPYMDSILRESGNGLFSEILKFISILNSGLAKTKALFFDEFYSKNKPTFVTNRVAKLFGNITEIKESTWIIMVDEIERAQFDEIYRLVEIIERFKNEGRCGLPVKLIFLFCISEPELGNYLDAYAGSDPRPRLLKTFFYEDPKSISDRIFLPPVDPALKQKYVLDNLNKIIFREDLNVPKEVQPHAIGDPSRAFMSDKDAAEYIIGTLKNNSPRVINRTVNALDFFYGAFKSRAGEIQKNAIRFSDILTLEYIKIRYPYLISFFEKTIHILINQTEMYNIESYFTKTEIEEKKLDLIGWIELVTGKNIPETEKPDVLKMVGLVMHYYFDFLKADRNTDTKDQYFGTTSYPEIMNDYLSLTAEGTQTNYRKNNAIYQKHKLGEKDFLTSLDNNELISYARFLFDVPQSSAELNLDLIKELKDRLIKQKIKADPMNVDESPMHEAAYQFVFQIVAVTEKGGNSTSALNNIKFCFLALKAVLSAAVIPTGFKYTMLSSLVNSERGSGSSIHSRLEISFRKILSHYDAEVRELIKNVFKETDERYLKGKKVLYELEENFFFTLYQGWSGLKDNLEEIKEIRGAAKRGLKNYPQAIRLYWRKYPIGEGWTTFEDVLDADHFFTMYDTNNPLYMPLETLIEVTKQSKIDDEEIQRKLAFWNSIKDTPRLKDLAIVKDETAPLKSFLIRSGLLKDIEAEKLLSKTPESNS